MVHRSADLLTPAITRGTRRARALLAIRRGEVGRSQASKARDRPDRRVHRVVGPQGATSLLVRPIVQLAAERAREAECLSFRLASSQIPNSTWLPEGWESHS